jgi:methylmalonyl-CoA mutase N-terminal domain/subunit
MPVFKVDETIRLQQIEKLKVLKSKRDAHKVNTCLASIKLAAQEGTNLMPPVIEAVENYCTLGEIADVLRNVFGEYQS